VALIIADAVYRVNAEILLSSVQRAAAAGIIRWLTFRCYGNLCSQDGINQRETCHCRSYQIQQQQQQQQPHFILPVLLLTQRHLSTCFTARRYARVLAVVCLCVCVCVCLSHAVIVSKRLNVGSRTQRHVIAQGI